MAVTRTTKDGTPDALRVQADPPAAKATGSSHSYLPATDAEILLAAASEDKPPASVAAATRKDTGKKGLRGAGVWGLKFYHIDGKPLADCKDKVLLARVSSFSGLSKADVKELVASSKLVRKARGPGGKAKASMLLQARMVRLLHDAFSTPGTTRHGVSWPSSEAGPKPQKKKRSAGGKGASSTKRKAPAVDTETDDESDADDTGEEQSDSDREEPADQEAFLARMEAYLAKHNPSRKRRKDTAKKRKTGSPVYGVSDDESEPEDPEPKESATELGLGVMGQGLAAVLAAIKSLPTAAAIPTTDATTAKARKKAYDEDNRQRQIATGKVDDDTGFADVSCDANNTMLPYEYHIALVDGKYDLCFAAVTWGVSAVQKIRFDGGELVTAKAPRRQITINQWHAVARQYGFSLPAGQQALYAIYVEKVLSYGRKYSPDRAMYYDRLYRSRVVANGGAPPNWNPDVMFFLEAFTNINGVQCPCGRPGCLPGDCDDYGDHAHGHFPNFGDHARAHDHHHHGNGGGGGHARDHRRGRGEAPAGPRQQAPPPQRPPCRWFNSRAGCSRPNCQFAHQQCCPLCIQAPKVAHCPGATRGARGDQAPPVGRG